MQMERTRIKESLAGCVATKSRVFSLQLSGKAKMRSSDVEGESSLSLLNVSKKPGDKAFQEALFRKRRNG